jgi:hypothetical protein
MDIRPARHVKFRESSKYQPSAGINVGAVVFQVPERDVQFMLLTSELTTISLVNFKTGSETLPPEISKIPFYIT